MWVLKRKVERLYQSEYKFDMIICQNIAELVNYRDIMRMVALFCIQNCLRKERRRRWRINRPRRRGTLIMISW